MNDNESYNRLLSDRHFINNNINPYDDDSIPMNIDNTNGVIIIPEQLNQQIYHQRRQEQEKQQQQQQLYIRRFKSDPQILYDHYYNHPNHHSTIRTSPIVSNDLYTTNNGSIIRPSTWMAQSILQTPSPLLLQKQSMLPSQPPPPPFPSQPPPPLPSLPPPSYKKTFDNKKNAKKSKKLEAKDSAAKPRRNVRKSYIQRGLFAIIVMVINWFFFDTILDFSK